MSEGRCRACGAALPPNAMWCSLCFADLRPPTPAPVRETAAVAATPTQPVATVETVALTPPAHPSVTPPAAAPVDEPDPLAVLEAAAAQAANPTTPATAASTPAASTPTWPCPQCGTQVPMDLDFCNDCGAGFLSAVADSAVRLPVIGEVKSMSSSQRLMMGVLVAIGLMGVIVLLAFIGGHLFS